LRYTDNPYATQRAQISSADKVLVLGAGAIGLTVIDFAKLAGADVYVAEISPFRRNMAKRFGADVIFDPSKEDTVEKILELTDGEGVGIVKLPYSGVLLKHY
jgi:threonine dehydrogenase-like Zn-dependent dehydrogenase